MSNPTPLEQTLANLADAAVQAAGQAVAANNPDYDTEIAMVTGFVDSINSKINPAAAPAASQIAAAATALGATVTSAPNAAETLASKTATSAQKASAVGILINDAESVAASVIGFFKSL